MIMVDNRELETEWHSANMNYLSLTSSINFNYAQRHGYDFLLFRLTNKHLTSKVYQKYHFKSLEAIQTANNYMNEYWTSPTKQELSVFNPHLRQYRASPWAKLTVVWNLLILLSNEKLNMSQKLIKDWDYIFYVDSDLAINPTFHGRSLNDVLNAWIPSYPKVNESPIVFFSNYPFLPYPCSGGVLFKTNHQLSAELVAEWWNWNLSDHNFVHEYEQAALWDMLAKNHSIKYNITYLENER